MRSLERGSSPSPPPLLQVESLCVSLRAPGGGAPMEVLDRVSFSVSTGESVGLAGESGGGKTFTALAVLGLLPPGVATVAPQTLIRFQGMELTWEGEGKGRARRSTPWAGVRGRGMAMVGQEPMTALNPVRTVGSMLMEALWLHGPGRRRRAELRADAARRLEEVGIPDPVARMASYPHELSGGMRQRVTLALALAGDPLLLVADEPTTALDSHTRDEILALLEEVRRRRGMALLLISHDLSILARMCSRLLVMYSGSLVEAGVTPEVLSRPRHPYTRALLDTLPPANPSRDTPLVVLPGSPPRLGEWPSGCRFHPRCPHVMARCRAEAPPMELPVACWLAVESAPGGGATSADAEEGA